MSSLACASYDIGWSELTMDTLLLRSIWSIKVDHSQHDPLTNQPHEQQSRATAQNDQPLSLSNTTRRSSSALEKSNNRSTKSHDNQPSPLSTKTRDHHHHTKRYSALQFNSSSNPCLDPATLSTLFQEIESSQSAPVSPTENVSRRPSFSSRIIKKTFDMKSLLVTTFDRYRKDNYNLEREQTALTIWRNTFNLSLQDISVSSPYIPLSSTHLPSLSASSSALSSMWTPSTDNYDNMSSLVQKQTSKSSKYARFIMMELLSTEENYMNDLYIIKTKFMDPLLYASQQPRPIINNRDIRTIFAFIPQLLLLSATLVQHLKTAIKNTNLTSEHDDERPCDLVGRILYNLETSFDIYVYYAVNFRKSRKCLDRIDCDSLCYQLLQESSIRRKETKRMDLNNFMITPIQRITRYCLILKDLQKHSSQCLLLDRSVKCMTSLAFAMNEIQ